ncbi:MAG: TonB-dependent siderophore receptor [Vibrio sp.]
MPSASTHALTPLSRVIRLSLCTVLISPLLTTSVSAQEEESLDTMTITASAMKVSTPLAESPRSVSIVDEAQLETRKPNKLDEAVRYQSGVVTQPYGSDTNTEWFKVRGFDAATYLDGNRLYQNGYYTWTLEPYGLESIEVLKGPASILFGEAPPGGVVNAVSKHPLYEDTGSFDVRYGTDSLVQLGIDVNQVISDSMRFRMVGMINQEDGALDGTDNDRYYFAPSLAIDISPDTNITLLASVKKDEGVPTGGFFPAYGTLYPNADGEYIDESTNLGNPNVDNNESLQVSVGYELEHFFNSIWSFKQNVNYAYTDLDLTSTYAYGSETSDTVTQGLLYRNGDTNTFTADNQVIAEYGTGRFEHLTLMGVEYEYFNNDGEEYDNWGWNSINSFNPDHSNYPALGLENAEHKEYTKNSTGVYAQHQVKFDGKWIAKAGVRWDDVSLDIDNHSASTKENIDNDETSWNAGVMYLSDSGLSPYVSYSESFEVIAQTDPSTGNAYKPLEGEQYEVGVKYEPNFFNGYVNLAWFDIEQTNGLVYNPDTFVQTQAGKLTSQGVEFDLVAQTEFGLMTRANYTYTDAKTKDTDEYRTPLIPRHMASAWVEYDFTHLGLDGFIMGTGVRYNGRTTGHTSDGAGQLEVPSYTVVDAMASYEINNQWKAQVNVSNLGDRDFVASCDYYCYYGEGINAVASLNYQW